ncbi:MAG: hypothetical protein V2B20_13730 [Pseudomonadota bacterium]
MNESEPNRFSNRRLYLTYFIIFLACFSSEFFGISKVQGAEELDNLKTKADTQCNKAKELAKDAKTVKRLYEEGELSYDTYQIVDSLHISQERACKDAKKLFETLSLQRKTHLQGNNTNPPVISLGDSQAFSSSEEYRDSKNNTDSITECPKKNPGKVNWTTFPKQHHGDYLYCEYYDTGELGLQVPYVNKKRKGLAIAYFRNGETKTTTEY